MSKGDTPRKSDADHSRIDPIDVPVFEMTPPTEFETTDQKLDWVIQTIWQIGRATQQTLPLLKKTHHEVRKTNGRVSRSEDAIEDLKKKEETAAHERHAARETIDRIPHIEHTMESSLARQEEHDKMVNTVTRILADSDRNYEMFRNAKERHDKALRASRSWVDKIRGYKDLIYVVGFVLLVLSITGNKLSDVIEEILSVIF